MTIASDRGLIGTCALGRGSCVYEPPLWRTSEISYPYVVNLVWLRRGGPRAQ